MPGPAVEQRGRRAHEVKRGQHVVELNGPRLAIKLVERQPHRHPHEEGLRQLEDAVVMVQEVAVVQRLQPEVPELQVALGPQRRGKLLQIEQRQLLVQQLRIDAVPNEAREVLGVPAVKPAIALHLGLRDFLAQHFAAQRVQQKAGGDVGICGLLLDQGAGGQDRRLVDLIERYAVVEVLDGLLEDRPGRDLGQPCAGRLDQGTDARHVERHPAAVLDHGQRRRALLLVRRLLRSGDALLCALLAVDDVGASDIVCAVAHQHQFHLVLHFLNVEGPARGLPAQQGLYRTGRQLLDLLADGGRGSALAAAHGEEGLGHGQRDLGRFEADYRPIAPDQLVVGIAGRRRATGGDRHARRRLDPRRR